MMYPGMKGQGYVIGYIEMPLARIYHQVPCATLCAK